MIKSESKMQPSADNATCKTAPPEYSSESRTILDLARRDSVQSNASTVTKNSEGTRVKGPAPPEPPDGGFGWMVVIGAILTGALVPSLFMCFGVFMNAFIEVFPNTSKSSAAWIPSIMSSLMNCMGPITSALVNLYSARLVTLAGGIVLSTGLVLSYFTSSVEALYLTYGILGGIGAGLSIAPGLYLISAYFKKRRGLATGICMAGGSIGQILTPYLIQFLLDEYNYRGCILILGGLTLNICVSAALYRPLQPTPTVPKKTRRIRSVSQSSRRSSLTFIPDEGICMTNNGNYVVMAKKNAGSKKPNDSKKKKRKKSKNNNNNRKKKSGGGASKNEIQAILIENTWNSIKQNDSLAPVRGRSRTLSMDSSRILPDIPEEHEDEEHQGSDTEQEEEATTPIPPNDADDVIAEPTKRDVITKPMDDVITEPTKGDDLITEPTKRNDVITEPTKRDDGITETTLRDDVIKEPTKCDDVITEPIKSDDAVTEKRKLDEAESPNTTNVTTNSETDVWKRKSCDSVSVILSAAESDDDFANGTTAPPRQALECVTLHHGYGSVASIVSLYPSLDGRNENTSVLKNISKFLGFEYFKESIFYIIAASFTFLIVALTNYTMFIPTYGTSIHLSKDQSAGLVSIIAIASMFGRLTLPTISDFVEVKKKHIYMASCALISGSILITIFSTSYEMLVASLVFFGFSTGGSISLSISVCLDYVALDKFAGLFGLVQLIVGITVLFATPLFGLLVDATSSYSLTFTALCIIGSLSGLVLYLDRFSDYQSVAPPEKLKSKVAK